MAPKRRPREHGTDSGYQQHKNNGEAACQDCLDAHNAYRKMLEERNPYVKLSRQIRVAAHGRALRRLANYNYEIRIIFDKLLQEELHAERKRRQAG